MREAAEDRVCAIDESWLRADDISAVDADLPKRPLRKLYQSDTSL